MIESATTGCDGSCPVAESMQHHLVRTTEELNGLREERAALMAEVSSMARRLAAAKAELTKRQRESAQAPLVEAFLTYWRDELSTAKADIAPGGDRWALAAKALHRRIEKAQRDTPELSLDEAEQQALAELKLAVDGLKSDPWRLGRNERKRRYCGVEHVLKNEAVIEGFIADALGPDAPEHAAAQVVALPVADGARVRELQVQLKAARGDFDEAVRQLTDAKFIAGLLKEMLMTSAAHNGWLELELCRREGEDVRALEGALIGVYGERVFRAEAAYGRAA